MHWRLLSKRIDLRLIDNLEASARGLISSHRTKLDLCGVLSVRPVCIVRFAPKSYLHGGTIPTAKITVGKFLEDWLQKYAATNTRETSFKSYRDG